MPQSMSNNVPWDQIQIRWLQGESASAISKSLGGKPTRQGINKRARRENWRQLPTVSKKHLELSPMQLGQDTPENRVRVLELLQEGVSFNLAAGVIGVSRNTLLNWRKGDPMFQHQCQAARHKALADCAAAVFRAKERDWKAGKFLLEASHESQADYDAVAKGSNQIVVVLNIDRDKKTSRPIAGECIDQSEDD